MDQLETAVEEATNRLAEKDSALAALLDERETAPAPADGADVAAAAAAMQEVQAARASAAQEAQGARD